MKTCPFCDSEYSEKNDGNGIYHQCENCNSQIYNLSLLKRSSFNITTFKQLLISAKQDHTHFSGKCFSCEQPFREVIYNADDYQTKVYVCPTCLLFAIKKIDFAVFRERGGYREQPERDERKMSAEAEMVINELETKLERSNKSWILFDKSVKLTKSKTIGSFTFMILIVIFFVRLGFSYGVTTPIGKIVFGLLLIVSMISGLVLIIGKENIKKVIETITSKEN
ncbi:MAG: hypothetical protein HOD64_05725 [Candidatus Cloacimonetes bacterium]|nr:hypothetical protein [Candidatus Cloacimonadota bacterium]MBT4332760.1 hypothetical protein [Candidatus Cloacimonadota bacterium]